MNRLVAILLVTGAVSATHASATTPPIKEYSVDVANAYQYDIDTATGIWSITTGADGNLWFTGPHSASVVSITPSGVVSSFSTIASHIPEGSPLNGSIVSTPDGNLWMPSIGCSICDPQSPNFLVAVDTSGTFVKGIRLDLRAALGAMTYGPNGAFWLTESPVPGGVPPGILEVTSTSGTPFSLPDPIARARGITTGPDGNVWFTENEVACPNGLCSGANARIVKLTPTGALTEFPVPAADSYLGEIVTGPDGNLWFTESQGRDSAPTGGKVARITPSGAVIEFALPTIGAVPVGIAKGPDGNIWFTEHHANQIGRITTLGAVTEYLLPTANSGPLGITAGPDGNIWFTEGNAGNVGKLTLSTAPIVIDGYMSGNWYDPTQSGQGFQLEMATGNTMVAIWFTFAPDGSGQNWIYAQGSYDNTKNTVTLPAVLLTGAKFPPRFNASDLTQTPWGTITFTFTGCNNGTASWNSTIPGYGNGTMPIARLTQTQGTACP